MTEKELATNGGETSHTPHNTCNVCSPAREFESSGSLRSHHKNYHSDKCRIIIRNETGKETRYTVSKNDEGYPCPLCQTEKKTVDALRKHVQKEKGKCFDPATQQAPQQVISDTSSESESEHDNALYFAVHRKRQRLTIDLDCSDRTDSVQHRNHRDAI
ncbi:unnamed protein product [Umbelopsis vinacea]